jgi:ribosomal protein L11 methyltransferase
VSADRTIRVILPEGFAEIAGAVLMDSLGPFEQERLADGGPADFVALVFYPPNGVAPTLDDVLAALPPALVQKGHIRLETRDVSRDWVDGWKDHFHPMLIGEVRIRPPWDPAPDGVTPVDVVINPGLGFGTGLHPTTRGILQLLQSRDQSRGPLVDAGTGSGVLAIAAAKLRWAPVLAFDNDPVALLSARQNIEANRVQDVVKVCEADVAGAPLDWFAGATVLANMTLEPICALVRRLASIAPAGRDASAAAIPPAERPRRLVVSGVLAGAQECELLLVARECGFAPGRRVYETEWVSLELLPAAPPG